MIGTREDFRRALERIETGDFTSYLSHYPPMAVWEVCKSDEWVREAWRRAQKTAAPRPEIGLYVHVPFCRSKCIFCCVFSVASDSRRERDEYVAGIGREARLWSPLLKGRRFSTLYIGGGTPSLLDASQLETFFGHLRAAFRFSRGCQVSFEATPDSLTREKLRILRRDGVHRLTLGVQSLDTAVTRGMERTQDNAKVARVYEMARREGIPRINIDLMTGLPGQTAESFSATLEEVVSWRPDMIHISPFSAKPSTRFTRSGRKLTDEDNSLSNDLRSRALETLSARGYRPLGLDAMGLHEDALNLQLGSTLIGDASFLGLGPGAVSCALGQVRHVNTPSLRGYQRLLEEGRLPLLKACLLSPKDDHVNYLLNHFWRAGVSMRDFKRTFGVSLQTAAGAALRRLESAGIVRRAGDLWEMRQRSARSRFELRRTLFGEDVVRALIEKKRLSRERGSA